MFNLSFSAMSLGSLALPVASSVPVCFADLPLFAQLNLQNLRVPAQRVDNARKPMSYWMRTAFLGDSWAGYGGDDGAAGLGDAGAGGAESPDDDEIADAVLKKIFTDEGIEVLESAAASAAPPSKRVCREVEGANLAETYKWFDVPLYVQIMLSTAGVEKAAFEESGKSCWHWLRKTWARAAMDTVMRKIMATATRSTGAPVSLEGFGFGTVLVCGSCAGIVHIAARCATQKEFARELAEQETLARHKNGLAAVITVMNSIEATVELSTGELVSLEGFGFGTVFTCGSRAGIERIAARCATQEEFARELTVEDVLARRENGLRTMCNIEATVRLSTGELVSLEGFGFSTVFTCGSRAGIADIAASCATQEEFARKLAAEEMRRRFAAVDARTEQRADLRAVLFCGPGCVGDAHSHECDHWNGVAGAAAAGDRGALAAVSAELTRRGAAAAPSRTR